MGNFIARELDNYLHKNPETAKALEAKIKDSERDRKELSGIQKLARENARKAKIHNKNLRDCRVHYNSKHSRAGETTLFITEGISASGSITTARDAETQAVFSLRGKPLNSFGMSRKVVYENEEFNFLQHALNIENGLEELRYDKVVIATDADDDGMHIRILLMTFFIQFFPELIREGHLFILQTPLFRVRNKQQTIYCYSDAEREEAISLLGKPGNYPVQRPGRNLPPGIQGFHRGRDAPGPRPAGRLPQGKRPAVLLHGQKHAGKTGIHPEQLAC